MIRVLQYVGKMDFGGQENLLMEFFRRAVKNNIVFDFAVHSPEKGFYDEEIEKLGGRIFHFPLLKSSPKNYRKAWRIFWQKHVYDYTWFCMNTNSLANIIAVKECRKNAGCKILIHAHSSYADKGRYQLAHDLIHKINQTKVEGIADLKLCCSDNAGKWLFGEHDYFILGNGIDYKQYKYNEVWRKTIREEYSLSESDYLVVQTGHFVPVKNYLFTTEVAEEVCKHKNNIFFLLVGDGEQYSLIEKTVNEKKLGRKVILTGSRKDVCAILSAADLFICPSIYEGFSLSTLEAEVAGLPCVVSDGLPNSVQVTDRYTILNLDIQRWVTEILKCSENETNSRFIDVEDSYDIEKVAERYLAFLIEGKKDYEYQ